MVESHAFMRSDMQLFEAELARIRDDLRIPREFAAEVLAEAERVAARDPLDDPARDHRFLDLPFLTLDPPGSRDLDQAVYAAREGDGYRLHYAIADVGFFVDRGGALEGEAWRRGLTFYSPDAKTLLYPPKISEWAASLLAGQTRPAVVFTFALDVRGAVRTVEIARGVVRSRAQLDYAEASRHLTREREKPGDGHLHDREWSGSLALLEEIGRRRRAIERERGGVSLPIPAQQVERWSTALEGYRLVFEEDTEIEGWNAQISLLTGMAAAEKMIEGGAGLLRALDAPRPDRLRALRLAAGALEVDWPANLDYDDFIQTLDARRPHHLALLYQAARVSGSARYVAFRGKTSATAATTRHSAIAAYYAHATAPLRRLADRYVLDLLVVFASGRAPSEDDLAVFARLPRVMQSAEYRANMLEGTIVNLAEAVLLRKRVGEVFPGIVIDRRQDGVEVQISDPPVRAAVRLAPTSEIRWRLGQRVALLLDGADPQMRSVRFTPYKSN